MIEVAIVDRVIVQSKVGADGVLNVSIPLGIGDANRPVQVTIEPAADRRNGVGDYGAWLDSLAGRWRGDFVREDEGPFEPREPLP